MKKIVMIALLGAVFTGNIFGQMVIQKKPIDLLIDNIALWGCKCQCIEKYDALVINEGMVEISNRGAKTTALIVVSYFDLQLGQIAQISKKVTFTGHELVRIHFKEKMVKKSFGIKAVISPADPSIKDSNPTNNTFVKKSCDSYE